jgi:hypothetical protein
MLLAVAEEAEEEAEEAECDDDRSSGFNSCHELPDCTANTQPGTATASSACVAGIKCKVMPTIDAALRLASSVLTGA